MQFKIPWKNSIFTRLLITFLFVLLPILVIGYSIYNWGLNTVQFDITNSMQAQVDFYKQNLEKEIGRIRYLQYDLYVDPDLNRLIQENGFLSNYDRDMDLVRIQERLNAIKNSSRYIEAAKLYIPSLRKTVTDVLIRDTDDSETEFINKFQSMSNLWIYYWKGQVLLYATPGGSNTDTDKAAPFIIEIDLSETELSGMLQELQIYKGSGAFLLNSGLNFMVYDNADKSISDKISGSLQTNDAVGANALSEGNFVFDTNGVKYLVLYSDMEQLGLKLVRYIPEGQVFQKVEEYRIMFLLFSITALIIIVVFSFSSYRIIYQPLSKLTKAFDCVEKGDMKIEIRHTHQDEFKKIYERFNTMVKNLDSLIDQSYRQKILVQKAELKQLQTQINPHFLYNSFFILHRWIEFGYLEDAISFSQQLGNYFQFITRNAADEVPFSKEVEHARIYADIQAMRFSNRIKVEFEDLQDEYANVCVPRLILQPIIENAFEHGLEGKEFDGKLSVRFGMDDLFLSITVEDNGSSFTDLDLAAMSEKLDNNDDDMEITGIINIHRRLQLKFGSSSGIILGRSALGGLKVVMQMETKGEEKNV